MEEDHPKTIHYPMKAKVLNRVSEGLVVDPWGHHDIPHEIGDDNGYQPVIVRLNGR